MARIVETVELAKYLSWTVKAKDDPELDLFGMLIDAAGKAFNRYTGQIFTGAAAFTETLNGTGAPYLYLKNFPVNSITSITENGATVAATDYYIDTGLGFLVRRWGINWLKLWQAYTVTYNAGYTTVAADIAAGKPAVPEDIKLACLLTCADQYQHRTDKRWGISSLTFANQSSAYFDNDTIPKKAQMLLNGYRIAIRRLA